MTVSPEVLDWLARLISFDTTSRDSNLPLVEAVAEHARSLGLSPHLFPNEDGTKANLVVTVPDATGSVSGGIMLSGHSDVVPVDGQAWASDPFELVERDGRLFGRGTADMKGFDAVVVAALARLVEHPLREPVHIALSFDEEVGCIGAQPLVDGMRSVGLSPRVCFVGEPTSMRMIRGHKSINLIRVTLRGFAAHSSLTAQGVNAIEHAASIVRYWRGRSDSWREHGPFDDAYPIAHTTGSVNLIDGGNGVNIIPAQSSVTLEFRSIGAAADDQAEIDALRAFCVEVEQAMRAEASGIEGADVGVLLEVLSQTPGLDTDADAPAVALGRELGLVVEADKVTYGTEAGIYANAGISTVVVGPGDIAQAHKPDEFIEVSQLAECEAFIGRLVEHLRI